MHPVSILISTRNRAHHLRSTLASISRCIVPDGMSVELIVADNGSCDDTAEVVRAAVIPEIDVRYLNFPKPGKSRALNQSMAQAKGHILLHTDDDVRVPVDWISAMCRDIRSGATKAVAGNIKMAPHLQRSWMQAIHKDWLLHYEFEPGRPSGVMIGANMAFAREILDKVPAFDEQLGPGALGYADDVLFSWQVRKAGYAITGANGGGVEHHFDADRLSRDNLVRRAVQEGKLTAYLQHHWLHTSLNLLRLRTIRRQLAMSLSRAVRGQWPHSDGAPEWELNAIKDLNHLQYLLSERRRPRRYDRHGLRLRPEFASASESGVSAGVSGNEEFRQSSG